MSCSLRHLSQTRPADWILVKKFLFPETQADDVRDEEDQDHRWNWDGHSNQEDRITARPSPTNSQWLSECHVSLSSDAKLLLIARENRLSALYDRHGCMEILFTKTLDVGRNERITCVSSVSLASTLKSNEGGTDWTAILVGFNSGKLRIYTDSMCLLIQQEIHVNEPVTAIACQSFYSPSVTGRLFHPEQPDHPDQIIISLKNMVAVIEGFVFYQTVRSARSQLAMSSSYYSNETSGNDFVLPVTKWQFRSPDPDNKIRTMTSAGLTACSTFDHLVHLTFSCSKSMSSKQSISSTLIAAGECPVVGFYETINISNSSNSLLNSAISVVANKARNLIPLFGSGPFSKEDPAESPPVILKERLGIYDQHRKAESIVLSPDKRHAAVSDNFGRVTLIDVPQQIAVRIWKGYRDAECAFIEVPESQQSPAARKSLCLVIYAKRRGVIEVWRCEQGPRIAFMNVGKNCSLFGITHHLFGHNVSQWIKSVPAYDKCFILNHDDGVTSYIDVPFACTLTDFGSNLARDKHLLRELTAFVEEPISSREKMAAILKQLSSTAAKNEALVSSFISLEFAQNIAAILHEQLAAGIAESSADENSDQQQVFKDKMLLQSCCRVMQLCSFFSDLVRRHEKTSLSGDDDNASPGSLPEDIDTLSEKIGWQAVDVAKCLSLFSLHHSVVSKHEDGDRKERASAPIPPFPNFMSCFHIDDCSHLHKSPDNAAYLTSNIPIRVRWKPLQQPSSIALSAPENNLPLPTRLAAFMFDPIFAYQHEDSDDNVYGKSNILAKDLIKLLYTCWLSSDASVCRNWRHWVTFSLLVRNISNNMSEVWDEGSLPLTWKSVCGLTVSCANLPAALVGMFVTKSVSDHNFMAAKKKKQLVQGSSDEAASNQEQDSPVNEVQEVDEEEEWETLHVEIEKLNIAIKQLEDAFLLDLLLRNNSKQQQHQSLSLDQLVNQSSPGIVSELVAKWFIDNELDVYSLLLQICSNSHDDQTSDLGEASEAQAEPSSTSDSLSTHAEILQHVKMCFPHSMDHQVILVNASWYTCMKWFKEDPSVSHAHLLKTCTQYLTQVSNNVLRHNVCVLIWKTFICKLLQSLTQLTDKMAKIPKDRICKRDIGMGEDCLEILVNFSAETLDMMMETVRAADTESYPDFLIDDWWRSSRSQSKSHDKPLVHAAALVKSSNPSLVLAHLHLVQVLQFMIMFQVKNVKPLSLFMPSVQQALFSDMHTHAFDSIPLSDFNLNERRQLFLNKVIAAIARSTPSLEQDNNTDALGDRASGEKNSELLVTPSRAYGESNKWFARVIQLSREWELTTDVLRRRTVVELYANACDHLAREVSVYPLGEGQVFLTRNSQVEHTCRDKSLLAIDLLPIACRRVNLLVNLEKSAVDPHALQWMQATDCEQVVSSAPSEWTESLLQFIMANLPEGSQTLAVASSLMETIRVTGRQ